MRLYSKVIRKVDEHPVEIFGCIAGLVIAAHLSTLSYFPICWQDEAQILEFGRCFLEKGSSWSTNLTDHNEMPTPVLFWFGPVSMEVAYRLFGESIAGHRLWALFTHIMLCFGVLKWLQFRGNANWISLSCSILVLFDSSIIMSVRGARVDAMAMAFIVWALAAIRYTERSGNKDNKYLILNYAFIGAMLFAAFYTWLTAIILSMLVAAEVLSVAQENKWTLRNYLFRSLGGLLGISSVFLLVSLPMRSHLLQSIGSNVNMLSQGTGFVASPLESMLSNSLKLFGAFKPALSIWGLTPIVLIVAMKKLKLITSAFLVTAFVFSMQYVYVHRLIYFIPFLVVFTATGLTLIYQECNRYTQAAMTLIVLLSMSFTGAINVGKSNLGAYLDREKRSISFPYEIMKKTIGEGDQNVLLYTDQLYHIGRSLDWKMFMFWGERRFTDDLFQNRYFLERLASCKYVIIADVKYVPTQKAVHLFKANGFERLEAIQTVDLRQSLYGPFYIFKRQEGS